MHLFITGIISLVTAFSISAETVSFDRSMVNPTTDTITARVKLDPDQAIRENSVSFSVNHPDVTITSWKSDRTPTHYFDKKLKETHSGYTKAVVFTLNVQHPENFDAILPVELFMQYVTNTHKHP